MSRYVALLRGINVGGKSLVAMADLRKLLGDLGFKDAQSLLQSGNLVFSAAKQTTAGLERKLEAETEKRLGRPISYMVRTAAEWKSIVTRNPFPDEAKNEPGHLVAMCLKQAPSAKTLKALQAAIRGPEVIRGVGKQVYIVYPEGIGRSKLTHALIEKTLGTSGTGRNWNTVLKLAALVDDEHSA